ncbi:hypothetical protein HPP92_013587 [Vanilla planifolia]|uniref:U6 small nuclear RNA (adenine-(43)-N(6))-methyltransferase n=1 Tax=Vanilla planifolia TaxID=51239 RepID=A0A835UYZ3_VANPL|nr:hypothetical protein HPP92_013587 [Vanilla planifolia]
MWNRKRRREDPPSIHPRNRYADQPPDFGLLASLYPSFKQFVFSSRSGRPAIDWKDYNATRELTRVLLLHDHGINWWIPDGQLCPTVPNRLNYIHWIDDLLSSDLIPKRQTSNSKVKGFDIGTGANCIYPLLGASLLGWEFVGSEKDESQGQELKECGTVQPPVLVGVVKEGETFDFCICNPPFFESIEEAGLNPKTSCGGTTEEMVCPGGEITFVTQIIKDSVVLKCSFRWFTVMIGRKINLKSLMSKLREVGVSIVKTTEFVQGRTARWGLAWSFMPPCKDFISSTVALKSHCSFTLEVIPSCLFSLADLIIQFLA